MQHSNHRTAALIASKPARIITSAALAVALTATPMLSPVAAYAASQATQDQLSAAQKKIEDATSAYNDARTKLEDLQKQIDSNEANIDKIEAELPEQQAKASSAMRDLYKYQKGTSPIVSFLVNTQSLGDFITTCKYTNQITSSSVDEIEELNKMQTELEQNKTELDQPSLSSRASRKMPRMHWRRLSSSAARRRQRPSRKMLPSWQSSRPTRPLPPRRSRARA